MLPLEWIDHLIPPPGSFIIERAETERYGAFGLVLPANAYFGKRKAAAKVIKVSPEVRPEIEEGDWIVLSAALGRRAKFGPRGERTLELCTPDRVHGTVIDPVRLGIEAEHRHPMEGVNPRSFELDQEAIDVRDEADPARKGI